MKNVNLKENEERQEKQELDSQELLNNELEEVEGGSGCDSCALACYTSVM